MVEGGRPRGKARKMAVQTRKSDLSTYNALARPAWPNVIKSWPARPVWLNLWVAQVHTGRAGLAATRVSKRLACAGRSGLVAGAGTKGTSGASLTV